MASPPMLRSGNGLASERPEKSKNPYLPKRATDENIAPLAYHACLAQKRGCNVLQSLWRLCRMCAAFITVSVKLIPLHSGRADYAAGWGAGFETVFAAGCAAGWAS